MENFRVFVAITPDVPVLDAVEEKVSALKRDITAREVRWEHRSKWHVTLRFLGDVPSADIPDLTTALKATCGGLRPFVARARGFGAFPSLRRPRVLWAGIEDEGRDLMALQAAVSESIARFTSERDEKRFHPHLTIARIRVENRRLSSHIATVLEPALQADFATWGVCRVELWRSVLGPGGSQYELLAQVQLES
ncbi:RNA 2',3'-cyclic phosphodiesterase [Verrucomicrobiota bacterium sgz303538]